MTLLAAAVGALMLVGGGIKPKAAVTFPLGIGLMPLAVVAASGPGLPARLTARSSILRAVAILALMLAKSAAWWTANARFGPLRGIDDAAD